MEKVKSGGGNAVKLQDQVKVLSNKVKGGFSLLCAELEKFGKKPDKKSAAGINFKAWNLICTLAEVKELVSSQVPTVKKAPVKEQIASDKPVVDKKQPGLAEKLYDLDQQLPLLQLILDKLYTLLEKSEEEGDDIAISMVELEALQGTMALVVSRIQEVVHD